MTARAQLIEQEVQRRLHEEKLQGELRGLEDELLRKKLAAAERKAAIESMLSATEKVKQARQEQDRRKMTMDEKVAAEVARQVRLLGLDDDDEAAGAAAVSSSSTEMDDRILRERIERETRAVLLEHARESHAWRADAPPLSPSSMGIMGERGLGGSPSLTRPRSEGGSNASSVITEASPNGTPITKAKKRLPSTAATAEVISVTASDTGNTPNTNIKPNSTLILLKCDPFPSLPFPT